MTDKSPFYVTTPIYYVNADPHIGHAYTALAADVLARFKRLDGHSVHFLTGTDEHGAKVAKAARAQGMTPQKAVDKYSGSFRDMMRVMNISHDDFIRTTEDRHHECAKDIWQRIDASGDIYKGGYEGWYAVSDEAFYTEEEVAEDTDGTMRAKSSGSICEWMVEESYFFRLSDYQDKLLEFYRENPDFIAPDSRRNEVISFVESGLNDLSISRASIDWGVGVPGDDDHVMYVWLDALTNYLSALGYPDEGDERYQQFWPADIHLMAKDIIRFHAVYWPAFLMSAGLELPKRVMAHGWWTVEGKKMSKSIGNVISPDEMVDEYGVDPARFALLRMMPFGNDGDFSKRRAVEVINTDLANDLGNLAQRSLSMVFKNCNGQIPAPGELTENDQALLDQAEQTINDIRNQMSDQAFHEVLDHIWDIVRAGNAYIDDQAPWTLKNDNLERMGTILYVVMEALRHIALYAHPFMPQKMDELLDQLTIPVDQRDYRHIGSDYRIKSGKVIAKPVGIFPRLEFEEAA
jgi:methionyl-tRNA synthetase